MYSKERKSCQLTKHLLSTCVEKLGEVRSGDVVQTDDVDFASGLSLEFAVKTLHLSSFSSASATKPIKLFTRRVTTLYNSALYS